jgi:hypothetical protein
MQQPFHERCKDSVTNYITKNTNYLPIVSVDGRKVKSNLFALDAITPSPGDTEEELTCMTGLAANICLTLKTYFSSAEYSTDAILVQSEAAGDKTSVSFRLYERNADDLVVQ